MRWFGTGAKLSPGDFSICAMTQDDVLDFWFRTLKPEQWWQKNPDLDRQIADRFGQLHQAAVQAELHAWRSSAHGRLAEVIVLDQFSRNIHRDSPHAFAADGMALVLAQEAVARGLDRSLEPVEQSILYLPYMHSESRLIHEQAIDLYSAPGLEFNLDFERQHKAIIDRFGRYPHRNAILGRKSSTEELDFLTQPGSSF